MTSTTTNTGDPYSVLGLKRGASHEEIRRAYFRKVREHPPETDPETFKAIRAAYEQLRSAEQRTVTDLYLVQAPPPWKPPKRRRLAVRRGFDRLSPAAQDAARFDLRLHPKEVLTAAKAFTDFVHDSFRDDYEPVRL
jgi:curved DNA-binding protein CbpA